MAHEVAFMALAVILELLSILVGLYYFNKKFPVDSHSAHADANMDNASANKQLADASAAWLDNHNRMFTMMQERDAEIVQLNKRVLELESQQNLHEAELAKEQALRKEAEEARLLAEQENRDLRKQVDELRQIVNQLKDEIASLKQVSPPVPQPPTPPTLETETTHG